MFSFLLISESLSKCEVWNKQKILYGGGKFDSLAFIYQTYFASKANKKVYDKDVYLNPI